MKKRRERLCATMAADQLLDLDFFDSPGLSGERSGDLGGEGFADELHTLYFSLGDSRTPAGAAGGKGGAGAGAAAAASLKLGLHPLRVSHGGAIDHDYETIRNN